MAASLQGMNGIRQLAEWGYQGLSLVPIMWDIPETRERWARSSSAVLRKYAAHALIHHEWKSLCSRDVGWLQEHKDEVLKGVAEIEAAEGVHKGTDRLGPDELYMAVASYKGCWQQQGNSFLNIVGTAVCFGPKDNEMDLLKVVRRHEGVGDGEVKAAEGRIEPYTGHPIEWESFEECQLWVVNEKAWCGSLRTLLEQSAVYNKEYFGDAASSAKPVFFVRKIWEFMGEEDRAAVIKKVKGMMKASSNLK